MIRIFCLMAALGAGTAALAGPVDINTATVSELDRELVGVGPARAARIVTWRDAHGPFTDAQDLLSVPYIGPRTVAANRPWIRVR